ncbi:B12-binding domain-containing protein [uncultured Roseobacter sp.]|uniref:cobalamin B12-binding domain-containing protein n=1 Tax=uncultured Roseobacter sp. TaxID=114847 RepID=UPI0026070F2C|nr:cobalamin B12-binding domain-containing protein [uncultured Roseobacter sp.]
MSQDDQSDTRGLQQSRPNEVGVFATRVISALRERQVVCSDGVRQFVLDHLVRAILTPGDCDPAQLFEELRGHRLSVDAVIDLYIPRAACCLGQSWVDDDITFADVTVGALRLQAFLEEASAQSRLELVTNDARLRAIVVLPRGEQHFLGVSVVAAQLRRMGCEVSVSFDECLDALSARVIEEQPDMVLISCSRRETLETIKETVQVIRQVPMGPMIALGGAVMLDADDLKERTGVDIVTGTAKDAVAFCSKRAHALSRL